MESGIHDGHSVGDPSGDAEIVGDEESVPCQAPCATAGEGSAADLSEAPLVKREHVLLRNAQAPGDDAALRRQQPHQGPHRRRLGGTRLPDDAKHLEGEAQRT
jgi:hypothetical protein